MHVVLATQHLASVGGSETYLATVAENLVRLGHQVTVHAQLLGAMSDVLRETGAAVVLEDDLPEACDALLVQDSGMGYAMAERWPGLPQVVVAHSAYFDLQLPPLVPVPGSVVIAMSDRVRDRVAALPGTFEVVRLRQPIDSVRLAPRGAPSPQPRRAVLLGNYLEGDARDAIVTLGPRPRSRWSRSACSPGPRSTWPRRSPTRTSWSARAARSSTGWPAAGRRSSTTRSAPTGG